MTMIINSKNYTWNPGRRRYIALLGAVALFHCALVSTVLASDGVSVKNTTLDGRSFEEYSFKDSVREKAVACHPTGKFCSGLFEEMVLYIRFSADGEVRIALHPDAVDAVNASGFCTLFVGSQVLISKDNLFADRFITQIMLARALEESFRIDWVPGASGNCEVNKIYSPY